MIASLEQIPEEIVASRLIAEGAVQLRVLADKIVQLGGCPPTTDVMARWCKVGKRGVKLEAYRGDGGGWSTSLDALARFYAAQTAAARAEGGVAPPLAGRARRESDKAAQELAKLRRRGRKKK